MHPDIEQQKTATRSGAGEPVRRSPLPNALPGQRFWDRIGPVGTLRTFLRDQFTATRWPWRRLQSVVEDPRSDWVKLAEDVAIAWDAILTLMVDVSQKNLALDRARKQSLRTLADKEDDPLVQPVSVTSRSLFAFDDVNELGAVHLSFAFLVYRHIIDLQPLYYTYGRLQRDIESHLYVRSTPSSPGLPGLRNEFAVTVHEHGRLVHDLFWTLDVWKLLMFEGGQEARLVRYGCGKILTGWHPIDLYSSPLTLLLYRYPPAPPAPPAPISLLPVRSFVTQRISIGIPMSVYAIVLAAAVEGGGTGNTGLDVAAAAAAGATAVGAAMSTVAPSQIATIATTNLKRMLFAGQALAYGSVLTFLASVILAATGIGHDTATLYTALSGGALGGVSLVVSNRTKDAIMLVKQTDLINQITDVDARNALIAKVVERSLEPSQSRRALTLRRSEPNDPVER
ncbi:hypothetical protein [Nocardia sp.]|uniref:hypothetical protein n=1 Tax=Nocardia sp. TaxID=1821 RepID=UPI00262751E8|nr:hypothetical protein [Nocardia sp.]